MTTITHADIDKAIIMEEAIRGVLEEEANQGGNATIRNAEAGLDATAARIQALYRLYGEIPS